MENEIHLSGKNYLSNDSDIWDYRFDGCIKSIAYLPLTYVC